jgi:hypothetical protein
MDRTKFDRRSLAYCECLLKQEECEHKTCIYYYYTKNLKDVFVVHYAKSGAHTCFDSKRKIQETSEVSPKLCPTSQ